MVRFTTVAVRAVRLRTNRRCSANGMRGDALLLCGALPQYDIEDDTQRVAVDVTFSDYFRDNPEVFKEYLERLEKWRTWLKS